MRMRSEIRVGIVLILGILLIVFGTIWMKGWQIGQDRQEVAAWFREVGQLQTGNAVKLRGVPIGQVDEIALDSRSAGVIVRMSVNEAVRLPEDPVVILAPESMFGDWQAEIVPRSRYPWYSYAIAPDPGVLPGYSLPDMSRLTAVADRIAENLAVLTDRIGIAFTDETAVNIRQAINNIQEVTAQLTDLVEAQGRTVQDVAAGLDETTATLAEAAATANRAFTQIESAIAGGQLTEIVDNVRTTTAQIDSVSRTLATVADELGSTVVSADSAFESLNHIMGAIERGEGSLGRLLRDTTLYADVVLTNSLVQDLILDFQRNPRKYINLRVF